MFAAKEGNLKLRKRFNANGITIERWRKSLGVTFQKTPPAPKLVRKLALRKVRRMMRLPDERIEDLDEFDAAFCVRSGGYGDWL